MNKNLLILKETRADESRVALIPSDVKILINKGFTVFIEKNAGLAAGFPDQDYLALGAEVRELNNSFHDLFHNINIIIRAKRPERAREILENKALPKNSIMVGALDPLEKNAQHVDEYKKSAVTAYSLDQIKLPSNDPMNLLSAMSSMAGKLALLDAIEKHRASEINSAKPASVVIIGFGIVGQAALKEALKQSLAITIMLSNQQAAEQLKVQGIKTVLLERSSGLERQQDLVKKIIIDADIVISSARKANTVAPLLIPKSTLSAMNSGSVIVDMALSEGGNVEGAEHDATYLLGNNITVTNISGYPKAYPKHASILWSRATCLFLLKYLQEEQSVALLFN